MSRKPSIWAWNMLAVPSVPGRSTTVGASGEGMPVSITSHSRPFALNMVPSVARTCLAICLSCLRRGRRLHVAGTAMQGTARMQGRMAFARGTEGSREGKGDDDGCQGGQGFLGGEPSAIVLAQ